MIRCEGLSRKIIGIIADELSLHFEEVTIDGEDLECYEPLNSYHYAAAWEVVDRYELEVM